MKVEERFLNYVSVHTMSDPESETYPSAEREKVLLKQLLEELKSLGLKAVMDDNCYVMATLPANCSNHTKLCFIAHVDTAPAVSGENIKPRTVHYEGGDIVLNDKLNFVLDRESNEELDDYIGQDIIVTDGTTLLGADDKAGVAEIMTALEYLVGHPEIEHCEIKVAFTPDEEVGRGVERFDVSAFDADFGYTVDGGRLGELEFENFNAAAATIEVNGKSIHPGSAKDKMKNAIDLFCEFHARLPVAERPVNTEGYEGFYMADDIRGDVEHLVCKYIIRDHDAEKFAAKKAYFAHQADSLNNQYGAGTFVATVKDSYRNMAEIIRNNYHLIDNAAAAFVKAGVEPIINPIRGGTDGANLSFKGLPCPNLSTGGHNFHGRMEYIPVPSMYKMVEVILNIIEIYSK